MIKNNTLLFDLVCDGVGEFCLKEGEVKLEEVLNMYENSVMSVHR